MKATNKYLTPNNKTTMYNLYFSSIRTLMFTI